jgi:hypothetical protein
VNPRSEGGENPETENLDIDKYAANDPVGKFDR